MKSEMDIPSRVIKPGWDSSELAGFGFGNLEGPFASGVCMYYVTNFDHCFDIITIIIAIIVLEYYHH